MNEIAQNSIYKQFIQVTWTNPPNGSCPKMALVKINAAARAILQEDDKDPS
jgi:hypothetical protein